MYHGQDVPKRYDFSFWKENLIFFQNVHKLLGYREAELWLEQQDFCTVNIMDFLKLGLSLEIAE